MRSADVAFVHVAHADGADDECGDGLYAELLHDVAAVGDDGREPDLQPVGDLFVQQTLSDERQHFRFAYGEQVGGRSAVLSACILLHAMSVCAAPALPEDSTPALADSVIQVENIQVTAIKQGLNLRNQPVTASVIGRTDLERRHVAA